LREAYTSSGDLRSTNVYCRDGNNPKQRPRRTAVYPPCDMPRSERCRIRDNCLHVIALHSLAQAPVARAEPLPPAERLALVERPRRLAAPRAVASRRMGLSPSNDRWAGKRPFVRQEVRERGRQSRYRRASPGAGEKSGLIEAAVELVLAEAVRAGGLPLIDPGA
jgi:hypothetical protein